MATGGSSSLTKSIEILLKTGGMQDMQALQQILVLMDQQMEHFAVTARATDMPMDEIVKNAIKMATQYEKARKAVEEFDAQLNAGTIAADKAAKEQADIEGKHMRERIENYAKLEREAEASAEKQKMADGKAMRDRIEAYAKADAAEMASAKKKVEQQRELEGKQQRDRIEAYAKADREEEAARDKAAQKAIDDHKKKVRDIAAIEQRYLVEDYQARVDAERKKQELEANAAAQTAQVGSQRSQALARGFVEFSRGVEDFATGGPLGVLNNIPGVFDNIGRSIGISAAALGGLVTAVTLVATGAFVLWKNWTLINHALGTGHLETATEEMKRLEEATNKTADQTKRLNDLKEQEQTIAAQAKLRSKAQKTQAELVQEAISEHVGPRGEGAEGIVGGLMESSSRELINFDKFAQKAKTAYDEAIAARKAGGGGIDARTGMPTGESTRLSENVTAAKKALDAEIKSAAERLLASAETSPRALRILANLTANRPGSFGKSAAGFEGATPEGIARSEEEKADREFHEESREFEAKSRQMDKKRVAEQKRDSEKATKEALALATEGEAGLVHDIITKMQLVAHDPDLSIDEKRQQLADLLGQANGMTDDSVKKVKDAFNSAMLSMRTKEVQGQAQAVKHAAAEAKKAKAQGLAAAKKDEATLGAEAQKLLPAYAPFIEHMGMQNQAAALAGQDFYDPQFLKSQLTKEVAGNLRASGNNPALAPHIVNKALDDAQRRVTTAGAHTASALEAVLQADLALLAEQQHVQQRLQHVEMGFLGIANQGKKKAPAPQARGAAPFPIMQPGF